MNLNRRLLQELNIGSSGFEDSPRSTISADKSRRYPLSFILALRRELEAKSGGNIFGGRTSSRRDLPARNDPRFLHSLVRVLFPHITAQTPSRAARLHRVLTLPLFEMQRAAIFLRKGMAPLPARGFQRRKTGARRKGSPCFPAGAQVQVSLVFQMAAGAGSCRTSKLRDSRNKVRSFSNGHK